jgi:glucose uptake protein
MTLSASYDAALALAGLAALGWGLWPDTFRMAGRWRFELYWFDFALGVFLAVLAIVFCFGSSGEDISAFDNLIIVSKRQLAWAFLAGVLANLGLMFSMACVATAGMAVAYSVAMPVALATGSTWLFLISPASQPSVRWAGVVSLIGAAGFASLAHRRHKRVFVQEIREGSEIKRRIVERRGTWRAARFAAIGGVLIGCLYPMAEKARASDIEMGPYAIAMMAAAGVFLSTFVYNLYFFNLPVEGRSLGLRDFFDGTIRQHLAGLLGGAVWALGTVGFLLALAANEVRLVDRSLAAAIAHGAGLLGLAWGAVARKEVRGADFPIKLCWGVSAALFLLGIVLTGSS